VRRLETAFRGADIRSSDPIPFRYQNEVLTLERVHLVGEQTDLVASGTVRLGADPALNLAARGRMDLAALGVIDPQLASSGNAQLDAQLNGTLRRPLWRGRIALAGARLYYGNLPNGFDRINGTIVFDGNRGVLEGFRAETGGGQVQIGGFLQYASEAGLQFNLSAEVASVRVRYPEGLSTWVDGQVNWTGTTRSSLLEGRLVMNRQSVAPNFDLVQALLRHREESGASAVPPFLRDLRLNLEILSAPEMRLDTLTTRNLQTDVELRIQGTAGQPVWLGRIGLLQGEIFFGGRNYAINRGEITFLNPVRLEPILNLSVQARVQRYDITMDFSGPPDRLTVTYRSDPPLPTRDILSLLVAGSARETSLQASATQPVPQVGADSLLTQALRSQIGSRLDRLFGPGRFRVDPQISGLGRSTNASVALEQQLSDNLSVLYVTDVTSAQQQLIQAEWAISPKLSVVGIRDENGLIGVNFQITLRFR
jgi:translocation and assembly module TamB